MERTPLTETEVAVLARAYRAHPRQIVPTDEAMRETCESLAERGKLARIREGKAEALDPEADRVLGYELGLGLHRALEALADRN